MLIYTSTDTFVGWLFFFFFNKPLVLTKVDNVLRYCVFSGKQRYTPLMTRGKVSLVRRCLISATMVSPVKGVGLHHCEQTWCSHMPRSMVSTLYGKSVPFENCCLTFPPGPTYAFLFRSKSNRTVHHHNR